MRNFKRTLALVLAVIMVVGTFATVSAASSNWYDKAVDTLDGYGISNIGETGDEKLSRNEFVLWVAKIETLQMDDAAWSKPVASVNFSDVNDTHYMTAIAHAYKAGFIVGNGDGTFAPDKTISLAEASAVIVRLLRYSHKVDGLDDEWDMNYMRVAAVYCNAYTQEFYKNVNMTDTVWDPDYELTKGEAAYLLATILNFVGAEGKDEDDLITTSDGINLGSRLEATGNVVVNSELYYVSSVEFNKVASPLNEDCAYKTNEIINSVGFVSVEDGSILNIPASELKKIVRVSLGKKPTNDYLNEEVDIVLSDYIQQGALVELRLDDENRTWVSEYTQVKHFNVYSGSLVVDTFYQMKGVTTTGYEQFYGVTLVGQTTNKLDRFTPVLVNYDSANATSWTNIKKDENGFITSATLNFKGQSYVFAGNNSSSSDIKIYSKSFEDLSPAGAVAMLINVAQGECQAIFNDLDNDGLYDNVVVYSYRPFDEHDSRINTWSTEGYDSFVIYDKAVGYPTEGGTNSWTLTDSTTGKLQLIMTIPTYARYSYPTLDVGNGAFERPFYAAVGDIADLYTGIIESMPAVIADGAEYFTAVIKCTDGVSRTVRIPTTFAEDQTVTLPVTVNGASADYTFSNYSWLSFITDAVKAADAEDNKDMVNVDTIDEENWSKTRAYLAGKYVQFAIDANDNVVAMFGTEILDTFGVITNVEKTTTGDNTFKVTIAGFDYTAAVVDNPATEADESADEYYTMSGIITKEVRASASTLFDGANNKAIYNKIFEKLNFTDIDHTVAGEKVVDPVADLMYVELMKDGNSSYIYYIDIDEHPVLAEAWNKINVMPVDEETGEWAPSIDDTGLLLSMTEVGNKAFGDGRTPFAKDGEDLAEDYSNAVGYTAEFAVIKGYEPQYFRTLNVDGTYSYELKFGYVAQFTAVATYNFQLDYSKVILVELKESTSGQGTTQVVLDTKEEKELFLNTTDDYKTWTIKEPLEYYVDKDFKLYAVVTIDGLTTSDIFETDKNADVNGDEKKGDKLDYVLSTPTYEYGKAKILKNVSFKNEKNVLGLNVTDSETGVVTEKQQYQYKVLTVEAVKKDDAKYFPGYYSVTLDGTDYYAVGTTPVVVASPSTNGFVFVNTTIAGLADAADYFVTYYTLTTATVGKDTRITSLMFIGEEWVENNDGAATETPDDTTANNRIVYLPENVETHIYAGEFANDFRVVTNVSAFVLPTGEEAGPIYRSYATYEEAEQAAIDLTAISGDKFYKINDDGEIVGTEDKINKSATITSVTADGTVKATVGKDKDTDITAWNVEFFYMYNGVLTKAGDNKNVTLITADGFEAKLETLVKKLDEAQAAYDDAVRKNKDNELSADRLAYYASELEAAKTAYADAVATAVETYYNGQFWGFANSPLYKYSVRIATLQQKLNLSFNYIEVEDANGDTVVCVMVDSFANK